MQKQTFSWIVGFVFLVSCSNSETKTKDTAKTPADSTSVNTPASAEVVTDNQADTMAAVPVPADGMLLQFNFQKGKTYTQTMDVDTEQEVQGNKMSTGVTWSYDMKVNKDDGKTKTIAATYRRIAMNMNMGGQKMEITSDKGGEASAGNPMTAMMGGLFRAMEGKTFFMTINQEGDVLNVEGFDKIAESITDEMKVPQEQRSRMLQAFNTQFNDGMAKDLFAQSFNIFPDKKVKVGDSWQKKNKSVMGKTSIASTTTYTVKSIKGNKVELASSSKMDLNGKQATAQGNYTIDARSGLVLSGNLLQNMGGDSKATSRISIKGRDL
jgi:hypothetical protein